MKRATHQNNRRHKFIILCFQCWTLSDSLRNRFFTSFPFYFPRLRHSETRACTFTCFAIFARLWGKAIRGEIKLRQAFLIKHSPADALRSFVLCAVRKIELNYYDYGSLLAWLTDWLYETIYMQKSFRYCWQADNEQK